MKSLCWSMRTRRSFTAFAGLLSLMTIGAPAFAESPELDRFLKSETSRLRGVEARADRASRAIEAAIATYSSFTPGFDDPGNTDRTRERVGELAGMCGVRVIEWVEGAPSSAGTTLLRRHQLALEGETMGSLLCLSSALSRLGDNPLLEEFAAEDLAARTTGLLIINTRHLLQPLPWTPGPELEPFPRLADDASAALRKRFERVANLRMLEVQADDNERATTDLESWTPQFVLVEDQRAAHAAELTSLFDAALAATLGPGLVRWRPGQLTVSGAATRAAFSETLRAGWPSDAGGLDVSGVQVVPTPATVPPDDVPTLGGRPLDAAAPVQVHAVDADLAALRFALADANHPMIRASKAGDEATFALSATNVADALKQLDEAFPVDAASPKIPEAEGPRVTTALWHTDPQTILASLSTVLGQPVAAPGDLPPITLHVTDAPAEGVLRALASELQLQIEQDEGGFVLSGAGRPAAPLGSARSTDHAPPGIQRIAATVVRPDGSVSVEQRRDGAWLIRGASIAPDGKERLVLAGRVEEHLLMQAEGGGWEKVIMQIGLQPRDRVRMPLR
jgi:hypothetical protein